MSEEDFLAGPNVDLKGSGNLAQKQMEIKDTAQQSQQTAQQSQQTAQQSQQTAQQSQQAAEQTEKAAEQTEKAAQQSQQAARKAQKASTRENIDTKNTLVSLQGQNYNYSKALTNFTDSKKTFNEFLNKGKISQKDASTLIKIIEESSTLLEQQQQGTLTENQRDRLLLLESQFNKEMGRVFSENKHKFSKDEINWFEEQIEKSNERIKDLTADVLGIGTRNDFVDFHAQRLMEAIINQVNIANQQKELTLEQKMVEYMDKIAFIRESVKQVAEAKETNNEKKIEEKAKEAVENFYKSIFFEKYWKLLDVKNEFNIVVGVLDQWKELKTSIIAGGLILYKKYSEKIDGKNFVLVYWDKIKPESKRVWLSKIIYGYTYKKKKYDGMLEKYDGKKISSNCILVPIDNYPAIISKFKQAKIQFKHVHVSVL